MSEGKENETKEQGFDIEKSVEAQVAKILKKVYGADVIDKLLSVPDESENNTQLNEQTETTQAQTTKRKSIRKISEKLNDNVEGLTVFLDTREILPGMVVYVIDKVLPTDIVPYVTYKPVPRIITEVQDNGVNNGTVFLTYAPKVVSVGTYHSQQHNKHQVISKTDVIYSPLTKQHAEYVCKLLNVQSKQMYLEALKQRQKQR